MEIIQEILYPLLSSFSDLFNLPLPALWTAVLGDWDRNVEEHSEERIPVEEIILHERFHNFQHDIGKLLFSRKMKNGRMENCDLK